jgi:methylamine utilization protein MauE
VLACLASNDEDGVPMIEIAARVAGSVALVLIFTASVASKIRNRESWRAFSRSLAGSRVVPRRLVGLAAGGLVLAESGVILLQLASATRMIGAALAAALAAGLTVGVAVAVARGATATCQCFGAGSTLSQQHVTRNGALLGICLLTGLAYGLDDPPSGPRALPALLGAVTGVALAAVIVGFEDVVWALSAPNGADHEELVTGRGLS